MDGAPERVQEPVFVHPAASEYTVVPVPVLTTRNRAACTLPPATVMEAFSGVTRTAGGGPVYVTVVVPQCSDVQSVARISSL